MKLVPQAKKEMFRLCLSLAMCAVIIGVMYFCYTSVDRAAAIFFLSKEISQFELQYGPLLLLNIYKCMFLVKRMNNNLYLPCSITPLRVLILYSL